MIMRNINKSKIHEIGEVIESVIDAVKNRTLAREEYRAFRSVFRKYKIWRSFDISHTFNRTIWKDELSEREDITFYMHPKERAAKLKPRMMLIASRNEGRRKRRTKFRELAKKGQI